MEEYDRKRELWQAIKRNSSAAAMELLSMLALIFVGPTLRSLGAIAFAAGVSAQFSADGGFMNPEVVGDLGLGEAGFDKVLYQVPLPLGKLRVSVH